MVGGFRVLGEKECLVNVEGRYITSVQAQIQSVGTHNDSSTPECHSCAGARGTQMPTPEAALVQFSDFTHAKKLEKLARW